MRGYERAAQRARERRLAAEARERDLVTDPALLSDSELEAAQYRQGLYHSINNTPERAAELGERLRALAAERTARAERKGAPRERCCALPAVWTDGTSTDAESIAAAKRAAARARGEGQ